MMKAESKQRHSDFFLGFRTVSRLNFLIQLATLVYGTNFQPLFTLMFGENTNNGRRKSPTSRTH